MFVRDRLRLSQSLQLLDAAPVAAVVGRTPLLPRSSLVLLVTRGCGPDLLSSLAAFVLVVIAFVARLRLGRRRAQNRPRPHRVRPTPPRLPSPCSAPDGARIPKRRRVSFVELRDRKRRRTTKVLRLRRHRRRPPRGRGRSRGRTPPTPRPRPGGPRRGRRLPSHRPRREVSRPSRIRPSRRLHRSRRRRRSRRRPPTPRRTASTRPWSRRC
mmetsp:Transcript_21401/g.62575  ORF Transcript_21401/g.62575 Transcript_21401/m.62575 type:complete len:212 (+) Transcript_21401:951-1586(+)